jgi:hypothetical protein
MGSEYDPHASVVQGRFIQSQPRAGRGEGAHGPILTVLMPRCRYAIVRRLAEYTRSPDCDIRTGKHLNHVEYVRGTRERQDIRCVALKIRQVIALIALAFECFLDELLQCRETIRV